MGFVHLHTHTEYSLSTGIAHIDELISRAASCRMAALAITDSNALYGVMDFYEECRKNGIKPIIGCEVSIQNDHGVLVLLAENNLGYQNLCRLLSVGYRFGTEGRPLIDHSLLQQYREGLICLSGGNQGELSLLVGDGQTERAEALAAEYLNLFGDGNFYIELQDHNLPEEKPILSELMRIGKKLSIPVVATNDMYYVDKCDAEAHDIFLCIQSGKRIEDNDRPHLPNDQFYIKTNSEMETLFEDCLEAISNTELIADRCNVDLDEIKCPPFRFPLAEGEDAANYLRRLSEDGVQQRYPCPSSEIHDRLAYELDTIIGCGYADYFLLLWDIARFAKKYGISIGPGRESSPGSLVAYCIGITDVDPLRYGLLFERFLNPERNTVPTVAIDVADDCMAGIIGYLVGKYGENKMARMSVFRTLSQRLAFIKACRVFGISQDDIDTAIRLLNLRFVDFDELPYSRSSETVPKKRAAWDSLCLKDPRFNQALIISERLGSVITDSVCHAGSVALCRDDICSYMPLQNSEQNCGIVQYTKEQVRECGLMTLNLLPMSTLNLIKKTLNTIYINHGITADISKVSLGDQETLALLSAGDTDDVFQLQSPNVRDTLQRLHPTCFADVVALIALYRPGPLNIGMLDDYIANKNGEKIPAFLHPAVEMILSETHGILLYQEQVMEILRALSGCTLAEADLIRRDLCKNDKSVTDSVRENFMTGCRQNKVSDTIATEVFSLLQKYAIYTFNKSHAVAYGMISWQTAWLKAHYRSEFTDVFETPVL